MGAVGKRVFAWCSGCQQAEDSSSPYMFERSRVYCAVESLGLKAEECGLALHLSALAAEALSLELSPSAADAVR
ncbi:unnamed protein product [Rangifer tarandus platyrhynchus]|uniref:Uncharacterized protein n=2 Tax=Rangifer tarandus platyrhynchus TaxID=3082113 RepID=A0ACB0F408_RANTA|nr:unnamed protein product [Rangifer tarandus platyrhynchus]CAI9707725.1 unnamed protein product [Rangifer tarandus platyrhynchus]